MLAPDLAHARARRLAAAVGHAPARPNAAREGDRGAVLVRVGRARHWTTREVYITLIIERCLLSAGLRVTRQTIVRNDRFDPPPATGSIDSSRQVRSAGWHGARDAWLT